MTESEIARIRQQIELEYQAGQQGLNGLTITARHDFIAARQENIAQHFNELMRYMSPEEAMVVILSAEKGNLSHQEPNR